MWWFSFSLDREDLWNQIYSILPICSISTLTFYVSLDQTQLSLAVVQDGGVHVQDGRFTSEVADYIIQVYLKPTLDFDPSLNDKEESQILVSKSAN